MDSLSILLLSLTVAISAVSIPHSHAADEALLDRVCKLTSVYDFCKSSLYNDFRFRAADIKGLCIISLYNGQAHAEATLEKIKSIEGGLKDPLDKERIKDCKVDYAFAIELYKEAFDKAGNQRDYTDVVNKVRNAANLAIDCEIVYRKKDPIRQSPTSSENHLMVDFADITFAIVDVLQSG